MLVDFELIKRAQNGDGAAFSEIVIAYRKRILGTITRLIFRSEDAEDVAQEVFLRLYFSLDKLRTPEVGCEDAATGGVVASARPAPPQQYRPFAHRAATFAPSAAPGLVGPPHK